MALALASGLFGRILKGQSRLVGPVRAPFGPHMVRIQFRERAVEPVRNCVEIVRKQTGIDVEGHGRRCVTEHLLISLDVGAGRHGETGCGVPQLVRREPGQPCLLGGGVEEPRTEVRIAQHPALWSGKHQIAGAFLARWSANSSARKRGIGTERR
jgi:hypothetical protein